MKNKSIFRQLLLSCCLLLTLYGGLVTLMAQHYDDYGSIFVILTCCFLILFSVNFYWQLAPLKQALQALENGIDGLKDNDFSLTLYDQAYVEVSNVLNIYNELTSILRSERMDIFQRELLLDTVIQSTQVALVLTNYSGVVVYSNLSAKKLFNQRQSLNGGSFSDIYQSVSPALKSAILEKTNGLVSDVVDEQSIIYNVNCREFMLNGRNHWLYLIKNMTVEIAQKEAHLWKQVIRLISHELNNSLAPIASLTRSAKKIVATPEHLHMLTDVLETIGNRAEHLHQFISQYAKFAKLPKPVIKPVALDAFVQQLTRLVQVNCQFDYHSKTAYFDSTQIEQVVINLVKNAIESGSEREEVGVNITQQANLLTFTIYDRGTGLTESQMQQVLLPFFTTKSTGSGVGLALCNEIVNNHGGKLRLANRQYGGLCVSFSLALNSN